MLEGRNSAAVGMAAQRQRIDAVANDRANANTTGWDADIAKTLIELSSQQAAYQAALKAGANIVQASLMDFLR